jgi:aromatic amino acid aminotransferase I
VQGLPSPEYFPFASITADALVPDAFSWTPDNGSSFAWIWNLFSATKEKTTQVSIPKYSTKPEDLNLATALQYSRASGIPQLQEIVEKFTAQVYKPAYTDFKTFLHTGNTDGWFKTVGTLCNPGEGVLASEWTYPSALAGMRPYGVRPVPVPMDGQGMRADALHKLLSEWDADTRGMPR